MHRKPEKNPENKNMSKRKFDLDEDLSLLSKQFEINPDDPKSMINDLSEIQLKRDINNEDDPNSMLSELSSNFEKKSKKEKPKNAERRERKKDALGFTISTSTKNVPKKRYSKRASLFIILTMFRLTAVRKFIRFLQPFIAHFLRWHFEKQPMCLFRVNILGVCPVLRIQM